MMCFFIFLLLFRRRRCRCGRSSMVWVCGIVLGMNLLCWVFFFDSGFICAPYVHCYIWYEFFPVTLSLQLKLSVLWSLHMSYGNLSPIFKQPKTTRKKLFSIRPNLNFRSLECAIELYESCGQRYIFKNHMQTEFWPFTYFPFYFVLSFVLSFLIG